MNEKTDSSAIDHVAREQVKGLRSDFHEFRDETRAGFIESNRKTEAGFLRIEAVIEKMSMATPTFGAEAIKNIIGIGAVFVAAQWMTINLLVTPTREKTNENAQTINSLSRLVNQHEFRAEENKRDIVTSYERADHESQLRHEAQQLQIDRLTELTDTINKRQTDLLVEHSATAATTKSLQRICDETHEAIEKLKQ